MPTISPTSPGGQGVPSSRTISTTPESGSTCNDPASHSLPSNDEVRVVFDRSQFEAVWLGSSGGVVYVVHPDDDRAGALLHELCRADPRQALGHDGHAADAPSVAAQHHVVEAALQR